MPACVPCGTNECSIRTRSLLLMGSSSNSDKRDIDNLRRFWSTSNFMEHVTNLHFTALRRNHADLCVVATWDLHDGAFLVESRYFLVSSLHRQFFLNLLRHFHSVICGSTSKILVTPLLLFLRCLNGLVLLISSECF